MEENLQRWSGDIPEPRPRCDAAEGRPGRHDRHSGRGAGPFSEPQPQPQPQPQPMPIPIPKMPGAPPCDADVAQLIATGVLAGACPPALIDEILAQTGRGSQKVRQLPAPAVVYYVMALSLCRHAPLEEVLQAVCQGLRRLGGGIAAARPASKSAISQARMRLGSDVMRRLAQRVLRPLAPAQAADAWYHRLRVMALDGRCVNVPAERANAAFFGHPTPTPAAGAFPQARLLNLVECGTGTIVAAEIAPSAHSGKTLAAQALPAWLRPDMLVLADADFHDVALWRIAAACKAQLLWRLPASVELPVQRVLPDGSYLSPCAGSAGVAGRDRHPVRVIECMPRHPDLATPQGPRLVTSLLDPARAPARELVALYRRHRPIDGAGEDVLPMPPHTGGAALRSKTPDLVLQELWGLLLAQFAVRRSMMMQAALQRPADEAGTGGGAVHAAPQPPQPATVPS